MAIGLGNARGAIPKVNPNPRIGVGQAQAVRNPVKAALGNAKAVRAPTAPAPTTSTATSTSQASNQATVPATQSQPVDPLASVSTDPSAGTPNFQTLIPSYTPQAGQADPRDAQYWQNLSKLMFTDTQNYAQNLATKSASDAAYSQAQQSALQNRVVQQRQLGLDAIKSGLGASGWLDTNEAQQTGAYTQSQAAAALAKAQADQSSAAERAGLLQGFGIDAQGELTSAGGRYAAAQAGSAANDAPTPTTPTGGGKPKKPVFNAPIVAPGKTKQPVHNATITPPKKRNPMKVALGNAKKAR